MNNDTEQIYWNFKAIKRMNEEINYFYNSNESNFHIVGKLLIKILNRYKMVISRENPIELHVNKEHECKIKYNCIDGVFYDDLFSIDDCKKFLNE